MTRLLIVFTLWFPMMASAENLVRNPSFEGDEKTFVVNRMETPGKRYVFKARYYLDDADGSAGVPRAAQADRRGTGEVG